MREDHPRLDLERREQRRGAMLHIVVRPPCDWARPHWQERLRAMEGRDLRLPVDAEDQRPVRQVEVPANVPELLDEERIGGEDGG